MKCITPEISWHNRDPVLSVDIQTKSNVPGIYRLASGGTDAHVIIWYVRFAGEETDFQLDLAADLNRHQRAVNVVKWSPNGELLASGDDESVIFIWKQKNENEPINVLDDTNGQDKEVWLTMKVLRGHMEDVYDLSWSPNSQFLVSGSVDNSAIIWDVHKGKSMVILNEHKGFVQGVAWDPRNQHIATLSTDRNLRIYDVQTKRVLHRISKGALPVPEDHELCNKRVRYFHDDTLQTFFRRMSYTPDGKLLLTPAGVTDYDGATELMHTAYVFNRHAMRQPAIMLPCPEQYAVALRCCPILFKLRPFNAERNPPVVPLPYRMIFVVATRCSLYFYDTQQRQPFAVVSNIHYTRLTDATWSSDGRLVVVSSTDGFCSLITFAEGELGEEYAEAQAVLDTVLNSSNDATVKKNKKQKENFIQTTTSSEGEKGAVANIIREPLAEKTKELTQKTASPIAFRRKADVDVAKVANVSDGATTRTAEKMKDENASDSNTEDKKPATALESNSKQTEAPKADEEPAVAIAAKNSEEKASDSKMATPIAIKLKGNTAKSEVQNASEAKNAEQQLVKKIAMPIAVKRKSDVKAESPVLKQLKLGEKPATPIAFRRKADLRAKTEKLAATSTSATATIILDSDDEENPTGSKTNTTVPSEAKDEQRSATRIVNEITDEKTAVVASTSTAVIAKPNSNEEMSAVEPKASEQTASTTSIDAAEQMANAQQTESVENPTSNAVEIISKSLPADVVMDKEIIGSDERFDSPEKKCRPATPISVRRHPRTPNSASNTPTTTLSSYFTKIEGNRTPLSAMSKSEQSPRAANKRATPIATRRTPRVLAPVLAPSKPVDSNIALEEALDAWPLPLKSPTKSSEVIASPAKPKAAATTSKATTLPPVAACDLTTERTEDIRLVYEDSVDSAQQLKASTEVVKHQAVTIVNIPSIPVTPTMKNSQHGENIANEKTGNGSGGKTPNKTPRRVALKTISTPKSKKKIIE